MRLKNSDLKKIGSHPVKILENGAINWELHCGCCSGTAQHSLLTPEENQGPFQLVETNTFEVSAMENILESEIKPKLAQQQEKKLKKLKNTNRMHV